VAKDKPEPYCNYHIKLVIPSKNESTSAELNEDAEEGNFNADIDGIDDGFDISGSGEERSPGSEEALVV